MTANYTIDRLLVFITFNYLNFSNFSQEKFVKKYLMKKFNALFGILNFLTKVHRNKTVCKS